MQAGQAARAVESARRCIEVCELNSAPPFERFFGYAVLALAKRAAGDAPSFEAARTKAMTLFEAIPDQEKSWCEQELGELRG